MKTLAKACTDLGVDSTTISRENEALKEIYEDDGFNLIEEHNALICSCDEGDIYLRTVHHMEHDGEFNSSFYYLVTG